jgi:hypothetical protein
VDVDLLPSEQVLWRGKPARYPLFERVDRLFVPLWCFLVACFLVVTLPGPSSRDTLIARVFPVLSVVVLVWLVVARYGLRQLTLRSTEYVVTDRRLIVATKPFGSRHEQGLYLAQLEPPVVRDHGDGHGTITFGRPASFGTVPGSRPVPALEWIPDAERVRDLITEARAGRP